MLENLSCLAAMHSLGTFSGIELGLSVFMGIGISVNEEIFEVPVDHNDCEDAQVDCHNPHQLTWTVLNILFYSQSIFVLV